MTSISDNQLLGQNKKMPNVTPKYQGDISDPVMDQLTRSSRRNFAM